jgi:hypothetical protein
MFYQYCLGFDREVVHVVVVIFEPLLCQTINNTGRKYNYNHMNHFSVYPSPVMVDNISTTT